MDDAGKRREKCILLKWHGEPQLLDDLYWQCEAGGHERQQRKAPKYTWGELVQLWKSDPVEQQNLAASTRRGYLRDLELILAKNANMDMRKTTKQALRTAHQSLADTTRKADKLLTIVSKMWNYACDTQDWPLGPKPTKGIKRFGKQKSFEPWPQWMIDKPPTAPEIVHTGAELILGTGQRPAAAFAMQHDDFSDEWRRVIDEKSDERFETYCPEQLRKFVAKCPRKGKFILAKNLTEAVGYDAVEKAFREWRSTLGPEAKEFVLHGLRKLAIVRLAEAGCSDAEIQAVTNQSAEMVAYYRKKASRKILSKQAQSRRP
jgi:hypothetical protein